MHRSVSLVPELRLWRLHLLYFLPCDATHPQTSATIGYGHMAPDPDCLGLNLIITAEVISTVLLQASLLGVVYARFR